MDRNEHLLVCLAEECDEVGQRVMKALRFGLDEVQKGQEFNNSERIVDELEDLVAVGMLCREAGLICNFLPTVGRIEAKRAKIERYMQIGISTGALTDGR